MQIRIRHEVACRFEPPARNVTFVLRLSPRSHEGQHVGDWRLDSELDCSLKAGQDAFGNLTHTLYTAGPLDGFRLVATCEVQTFDTAGIVRGLPERLPNEVFLRDTEPTSADVAVRGWASEIAAGEASILGQLHALMEALHGRVAFDPASAAGSACAAFAARRGDARHHAHLYVGAARHLGIPSRFVAGYLAAPDGAADGGGHAWAECHVPGLGWVGFDSVENVCPEGRHVRGTVGLDAQGAACVRGSRLDGCRETLSVTDVR